MTQLDFSIVAGNNDTVSIDVWDKDGNAVILTGSTLKWQMFFPDGNVAVIKNSSEIAVSNSTAGVANRMTMSIVPADCLPLPQGYYPHEAVRTSTGGSVVTITDNDALLSYGNVFVRTRLTSP